MNLSFSHATFDALPIHGFKFVFYVCNGVYQEKRATHELNEKSAFMPLDDERS